MKRMPVIRRYRETNTSASIVTSEHLAPLEVIEEIELYSTHQRRADDNGSDPVFLRKQAD